MGDVTIQWIGGQSFVGVDSTQHTAVISSARDGVGVKPSDMLLMALAACSAVDLVNILEKKRLKLTALDIAVSGQQDADPPWTFRKIHLAYNLRGTGLTDKAVEQAIGLSEEKYCSVSATIRGVAEVSHSYQITED